MKPSDQHWHNRNAWDRLARQQNRLAKPARDEDFENPLKSVDGPGWLGPDISGQTVLCLAAGGGRQGPIYAAAGADVTVVDISPVMLELDQHVARQRNLQLKTLESSMDDLSELGDATFDIVIHPVSTCYVPDVVPVYAEVARVLRPGGIYISQHKQPTSLQSSLETQNGNFVIKHGYYRTAVLPEEPKPNFIRETGTHEYVHRWEQLIGAMCRCGLFIEDLTEPMHAQLDAEKDSFEYRCQFIAPYVRIKARRSGSETNEETPRLWTPIQ